KFKWEGQPIPLTPPMLAIAAAGNDAAGDEDAANEDNAAANEAAGSAAEVYLVPPSPSVSPVREPTPERQPASERPPSPSSTPPAQTFMFAELLVFGPAPRPAGYVDPDVIEPIIFGPQPRPHDFVDPDLDNIISMEDDTTHGGFHVESPVGPDDAPTPTADAAGRAEDPALLTSLSAKIDRCMGRIDSLETKLGKSKKIMGGAILTLVSRVKKLEKTLRKMRDTRLVVDASTEEGDVDIQDDIDLDRLSRMASAALGQPAVPSDDVEEREEEEVPLRRKRSAYRRARTAVPEPASLSVSANKRKAPLPELDIPAEFLAEDAQARKRFEEEQASERLVQRLRAEDLAQEDLPNVSEERAKELDDLMMRMTETDWLNLMMQVGSNPALARELLGADVTEENFIERMTAIKEKKKRALADLRYRALKGKPMKQSEVTQMMRNLVKNQWCAAHNGTITMNAVKAMTKQQLIEEYEYICRRLEKDRLLSAQYNLFRPKPAISEPPSKRQRVERGTSQPSSVPAATTQPADDPDSAGGGSSHPAGSATPLSGSAARWTIAMDYAADSVYLLVGILLLVDSFLLIGCMFLLSAWFLLLHDSFCWLNIFMLLELFMLPIHLFMLLDCLILLIGWPMPPVTWFLLVVSITVGGTLGTNVTASTIPTSAAMDSAGSHRESGVSPFADSADSSSPSPVSTDHIPIDVLFESTSGGINEFFLDSDEDEQIGMSRVAADPDSDDEVLAEIIFRGQSISGHGVVVVDKLPDDEIVDPRVKVETISESASSPPRSRRKHRGVRSDDSLWDKPVEDFFSSESESDDDMENYIPPLPYGAFKDWEMVICPLSNSYYHVYYQENRRRRYFTYLKQLLPYVYREDLLLLRRRMNRYFRLNPDVDVGLDLWRDVNLLCQSLHSDDVEDFWRTQDEWIVSSWKLYPKSSVHVLDLTNGKTVYMFVDKFYPIRATLLERMLRHRLTVPPSYCRDVVVAGNVIQTVQAGLRESYECLASTSGGILEFFLESDEEEQIGMSRIAADPDSDDDVFAEIIFRGKSISGDGVVFVDKLPDDEIVDPRVKVETVSESASSPPRSRRKHLGVRSDDFLWDKPVEDFFSSESESDDDMENYIPPLPYGAFKDWEIVRSSFFLRDGFGNRYFRLNPDVDVGLDLWRDVNMLCQSLHSDDVEDFWRTQDDWIVSSWKLYPKSSVHVLDLTNGKMWIMFVDKVYPIRATLLERMLRHRLTVPPSYCRMVVCCWTIIQTVQAGLRQAYECIASAPIPEQTATGKDMSNPLYGCDGLPKTVRLDVLDVAILFDSAVHRVNVVSFDAVVFNVAATVSAAAGSPCICWYLFLLLLNPLASRRSI
ncbi:hypothetical protein Tco_0352811, partial [Tanacetum coccineum]